ncbi:PREDICTED: membrane-spanning 4-domains subfamily A member 6D-like isoform X1 [Chinchilla lanigera]|uniref:Membrane-spanning 4-domains subfamily A member 6D-like n=1 Tax=Chinchilla lanigera TaxID=34839 RepID=A0A8C2UWC1_CHILA|nr:PREDICTED: membrane-spanning 4-domains subfamily A member 6D-like isoform X1 [Chinchilla lanigera]
MSQPITNDTVAVLTAHGFYLPQTEKPLPTNPVQESLKTRLKAEVNVFGVIQILCGAMVLSLGIILAVAPVSLYFTSGFSTLIKSAYPFVGALCFIISGSLSIVAEKKSAKPLVHGSLACSILSTALALLGVALLSYTMAALDSAFQQCVSSSMSRPTTAYHFYDPQDYRHGCSLAKASVMGTVSVMLICTALELCSAVLTAVLWWKQAQSDFPGSVLFQPESYKNNPYIFSKTHQDPGYEELVTSS